MNASFLKGAAVAVLMVSSVSMAAEWYAKETQWAGHDPDIIRYEDGYALMTTDNHLLMQTSEDALNWKKNDPAMPQFEKWLYTYAPNMIDIWAPHIKYVGGEYRVYYCGSEMGIRSSGMGFMSSKEIDPAKPGYGWKDQGEVIHTVKSDAYNAIDATVIKDLQGKVWMGFGSWGTGIHVIELDEKSGKVATGAKMTNIANRGGSGVEGASLIEHNGKYFLFTAWDNCCKTGANLEGNSYKTVVNRANAVTGPYLDRNGKTALNGGGTILLQRYGRYYGPAGGEAFEDINRQRFVNHYYDKSDTGRAKIQVRDIVYTEDNWPELGQPFLGRYLSAEAEHGILFNVEISSSSKSSNGEYVGMINEADSRIRLPMIIPQAGDYLIRYRYANDWTDEGSHFVDINGFTREVKLPITGAWGEFPEKSVVYIPTKLKRGSNFVEITKGKSYGELDRLDFLRIIRDTIPGNGFDNGIRLRLDEKDQMAIKDGGYAIYENVITDSIVGSSVHVQLKNCAGGTLSLRVDGKKGDEISKCEVPTSCGTEKWVDVKCSDLSKLKGVQDFYLTAAGLGDELLVGNIRFSSAAGSAEEPADSTDAIADERRSVATFMEFDATARKVRLGTASSWNVLDLNGVLLRKGFGREVKLDDLNHGTYIVRAAGRSIKVH